MNVHYTQYINNSLYDYSTEDEAFEFLTNPSSFRPFSEGLTEAIHRSGYSGSLNDTKEKTVYLFNKLKEIDSTIKNDFTKTITSWFKGTHAPKVDARYRENMFKICFALNFSYEQVEWFFSHVYFDRCCNCHLINEAIYYYCFLHGLPYLKAQELIAIIENAPEKQPIIKEEQPIFTQFYKEQIQSLQSEDALIEFLIDQKYNFHTWNQSAQDKINTLIHEILGHDKTQKTIDKLRAEVARKLNDDTKDKNKITTPGLDQCGLAIQEILFDATFYPTNACDYIKILFGKNVFSNAFLLGIILGVNTRKKSKEDTIYANIPSIIKNNFPSEKKFSDILEKKSNMDTKIGQNKIETLSSYDSIRKVLILLHFYHFWCDIKVNSKKDKYKSYAKYDLPEIYNDEADEWLENSGYEPLFAGNPYDWVFLYSSLTEYPLDSFRALMEYFFPKRELFVNTDHLEHS